MTILEEKAPEHQREAVDDPPPVRAMHRRNWGSRFFARSIGPCDQLGEKSDIDGENAEMPLGPDLPAVDVDGVAQGLEGVEGYPHRQQYVQVREIEGDGKFPQNHVLRESFTKLKYLNAKQQAKAGGDAQAEKQRSSCAGIGVRSMAMAAAQGAAVEKENQDDVFRLPAHVEIIARRQQEHPAIPMGHAEIREHDQWEKKLENVMN